MGYRGIHNDTNNNNLKLSIRKLNLVVLIEAIINTKCLSREEADNLVNDTSPIIFAGYDCIDKFMNHVFGTTYSYSTLSSSSSTDNIEHMNTIVLAHNFRNYDGKFVFAWSQLRSIQSDIIRNWSNTQMLSFLDGSLQIIDTKISFRAL